MHNFTSEKAPDPKFSDIMYLSPIKVSEVVMNRLAGKDNRFWNRLPVLILVFKFEVWMPIFIILCLVSDWSLNGTWQFNSKWLSMNF